MNGLRSQGEIDYDMVAILSAEAYPIVSNAEIDSAAMQMNNCCVVTLEVSAIHIIPALSVLQN